MAGKGEKLDGDGSNCNRPMKGTTALYIRMTPGDNDRANTALRRPSTTGEDPERFDILAEKKGWTAEKLRYCGDLLEKNPAPPGGHFGLPAELFEDPFKNTPPSNAELEFQTAEAQLYNRLKRMSLNVNDVPPPIPPEKTPEKTPEKVPEKTPEKVPEKSEKRVSPPPGSRSRRHKKSKAGNKK